MPANTFAEILKFNPYHDAKGRFASANSAASFTYAPGKSNAHSNAINREKERTGASTKDETPKGFKGTLYHGSPATDIKEFDMSRAGSNTSSGEKLLYFTDSKQMAEDFSYERLDGSSKFFQTRGKKGRVYEVDVEMKKPLDFRNLSDTDVENILRLDTDGLLTKEMVRGMSNNHQLLKVSLDLRADRLKELGYDGFIANTGKAGHNSLEYAVVDSKQAKIKKSFKEETMDKQNQKTSDGFSIFKTDDDKRLVFGWASVAIKVDGDQLEDRQKDIIDPEDLEEAAYEYVLNFRDTGEEHIKSMRKKGKLVESCVLTEEKQKAMGIPPGTIPVAWWIGFKIEDDDAWARVKNGTYKMFSIEGKANRIPVEKAVEEVEKAQLRGCGVLVVQDGKILSGTRIERGGRGQICGPGGHIEDGETPEEAAKREAMEEFGITCQEITPLGELKNGTSAIFLCSKFAGTPKTDEEEMTEPKWRTIEELRESDLFKPFEESLELLPDKRHSVAKTFEEILKANPYHDNLGRFTTANGGGGTGAVVGKVKIKGKTYKVTDNNEIVGLDGAKNVQITDPRHVKYEDSNGRVNISYMEPQKASSQKPKTKKPQDDGATDQPKDKIESSEKTRDFMYDLSDKITSREPDGTVQCHTSVGDLKTAMAGKKGTEKITYFEWDDEKWNDASKELKRSNITSSDENVNFLVEDIIDGSVNGHSFIKIGESTYVDPYLRSLNVSQADIDAFDSQLERVYQKVGIAKGNTVAKTFEEILKFNPFHDAKGRFASSNSFATYSANPKSKAGAMAISRSAQAGHGTTFNSHKESQGENINQNYRWLSGGPGAKQLASQGQLASQQPKQPPKPTKNYDKLGFADQDDADYHQLHSGRKYYQQQKLTPKQQQAAQNYLEDYAEPGSLYSHSQNMNHQMVNGQKLTGKYKQTHDGLMSSMHNIGYNVELTRYDHRGMIDGLLQSAGAGTDYTKMSASKIKKALVGSTVNENKFLSTSYNNFQNASDPSVFTSRAVKITYKVKANTQAMMPGVGPGGDFGEMVLAPMNGTTNKAGKIVDVKFTGQKARQKGTQSFNLPQIEIVMEIGD